MGTFYDAYIEVRTNNVWKFVSAWNLGKTYDFAMAVHELVGTRDMKAPWPNDISHYVKRDSDGMYWRACVYAEHIAMLVHTRAFEGSSTLVALKVAILTFPMSDVRLLLCQDQP